MPPSIGPRVHLGVMAKYWQPGRVKTRLGGAIGMAAAAAVHRELCLYLAKTLQHAAVVRSFIIDPADHREDVVALLPSTWEVEVQAAGDLGHRMRHWFASPGQSDAVPPHRATKRNESVRPDRVLIGADCPTITSAVIQQATGLLRTHSIVLGPARDGGYYLIGLRGGWRPDYEGLMTEMPWSTSAVFRESCRRAAEAGLEVATLDQRDDIDTVEDMMRAIEQLSQAASSLAAKRLAQTLQHILTSGERS